MDFLHTSVLLQESIDNLITDCSGIYVDGTLGGGGHALALAERLDLRGTIIGIDQDEVALQAAKVRLENVKCNKIFVQSNFSHIAQILREQGVEKIQGMILDLGVSSYQLDNAERGFSYMHDGLLDMRMDRRQKLTAHFVVNNFKEAELAKLILKYGEERWAKRIANFIVTARREKIIATTHELVAIIKKAIPKGARTDGPHPAKRTFQAIRIIVNNELGILEKTLLDAVEHLNVGGRIGVITFHSLEDRIVKQVFAKLKSPCTCPVKFPVCICKQKPLVKNILSIKTSDEELEDNHRARSARLRIIEKI